jgi:Domain of unknown function (DUF1707)
MCHRSYHYRPEREAEPIVTPLRGPIRVGDAERDRVGELLRKHAAAGRLDTDELDERLGRAYGARYASELHAVLDDLPPEPEARPRQQRPRGGTRMPAFPALIAVLLVAAAVTGAWWLLWLIWPLAVVLGPRRHYRRTRV